MPAFFAMIWDAAHADAATFADTLRRQMKASDPPHLPDIDTPGLLFLDLSCPGQHEPLLHTRARGGEATVFGTLFKTSTAHAPGQAVRDISGSALDAILASGGRALLEDYWGRYVAIVKSGSGCQVLLDPTGALPCYYTVQHGALVLFSHLELCPFLDLSAFSVNEGFVAMLLAYDRFLNSQTGLQGVQELLGGQCLTFTRAGVALSTLWSPDRYACRPMRIPTEEAALRLRETTDYVVGSWANCFQDVAVSLSGGLDSSIVLDCLARSGTRAAICAFHYLLTSQDAEERTYAELAARSAGCRLDIVPTSPDSELAVLQAYPPTVRPYREFLAPPTGGHLSRAARPARAAIFTGQGGDHLFLTSNGTARFADYLMQNGLRTDTAKVLLETARLSGKSVSAVLRETLPRLLNRRYRGATENGITNRRTQLSGDISAGAAILAGLPDWARNPGALPPAKFQQVSALLHMVQSRSHYPAPARAIINPLISQPLIELCLSLPAWQLTAGGRSRGLVREAFSHRLPAEITRRTTKGSASRFYTDQVAALSEVAGQLLRRGELVSRGLIAEADVDRMLDASHFRSSRSGSMLLVYCGIESWLRTWTGLSGSRARGAGM